MTERRRRRRRTLLVPVLGLGVAAWAVHRKLGERQSLDDGWQPLPPAPRAVPATPGTGAAPVLPPPDDAVAEPATDVPAEPVQPAAVGPAADVAAEPVQSAAAEPEPSIAEPEPVESAEPVERPRT